MARSTNLLQWHDIHYLDLPLLPWADTAPTAAMVLDTRAELGVWLMAFHAERNTPGNAHAAAIGFAWSNDPNLDKREYSC